MQSSVINDIKNVLNTAHTAIKKRNYFALEGLSNQLNHSITIHQLKEISTCATTIYALSKIFDKQSYLNHPNFNLFRKNILTNLKFAFAAVKKDRASEYRAAINALQNQIKQFGNRLKIYHEPILTYARARKAKHATEHGLSINQASKLFEVSEWEISKLTGKSIAPEKHRAPLRFNKQRIELVKKIFNISQKPGVSKK